MLPIEHSDDPRRARDPGAAAVVVLLALVGTLIVVGAIAVFAGTGDGSALPTSTTTTTTTSTTTTSTTTTTTTTSTTTTTIPAVEADRPIVVFGNSTDLSAGHGDEYRPLAWPAVLQAIVDDHPDIGPATVINEAQPGSTIDAPSGWGYGSNLRLVTHAPAVLDRYTPPERARMVVVIAPSVIDLQFNEARADASVSGLLDVVDIVRSFGVGEIVVLPMNPVSAGIDEHLGLNDAVESFNAALDRRGISAYPRSPLLAPGSNDGLDEFYDDYPGRNLDGELVLGDGIHIEEQGQRLIAETVAPVVLATLANPTPGRTGRGSTIPSS